MKLLPYSHWNIETKTPIKILVEGLENNIESYRAPNKGMHTEPKAWWLLVPVISSVGSKKMFINEHRLFCYCSM
jgi:hypothetical protein